MRRGEERVLVGLGSNLGDRHGWLERAVREVEASGRARWRTLSTWRETEPVGGPPQGWFLNGAGALETSLSPREVLDLLLRVEARLGRRRALPNGPRTIDLDLLLYGSRVVRERGLCIPHPRLAERAFVLEPLAEIAAEVTHPLLGRTLGELWRELRGRSPAAGEAAGKGAGA